MRSACRRRLGVRNATTQPLKREVIMKQPERWQTTLGDLIVALTDEVDARIRDEKQTYAVVACILADLFKDSQPLALLSE